MTKIAKRLAEEALRTLLIGLDAMEEVVPLISSTKERVRMRMEIVALREQMAKILQEEHPEDFALVINVLNNDFRKLYEELAKKQPR